MEGKAKGAGPLQPSQVIPKKSKSEELFMLTMWRQLQGHVVRKHGQGPINEKTLNRIKLAKSWLASSRLAQLCS